MPAKKKDLRKDKEPDVTAPHKFWDTQPVPRLIETKVDLNEAGEGNIEGERKVEDVSTEPIKIPEAYEWFNPDVRDPEMLQKIYQLLADNYVEDDDSMFRFAYPKEFLYWALTPPDWIADWHIGVRVKKTGLIVGFISGIPARIQVKSCIIPMTEINFLCVHKGVRSKRLAPVLIKEVTRRVNLTGVWQAVYTAGIVLPRPIAKCQYWHRSLNPPKLIGINFSRIPFQYEKFQKPMEATKRHYSVPQETSTPGLRVMQEKDVPQVTALLDTYLQKFPLCPVLSEDDVHHWFIPKEGVIDSYVVESVKGKITDFLSFYTLPSTIIGHPKYNLLKAAYAYYNVANTVPLKQLMLDALTLAKKKDFDVFNCLDIMDNREFLTELKFGVGDGHLQYYLFNWRIVDLKPEEIGLVML